MCPLTLVPAHTEKERASQHDSRTKKVRTTSTLLGITTGVLDVEFSMPKTTHFKSCKQFILCCSLATTESS